MKKYFFLFIIFPLAGIFLQGCVQPNGSSPDKTVEKPLSDIRYAQGFAVFRKNGKTKVVVYNPWKKGKSILKTFILVHRHPQAGEIKVPLEQVAVFSSTQLNGLQMLGLLHRVTGISEARFLSNPLIKKRLAEGKTREMAAGGHYFIETILQQKPAAIFYSPFQGNTELPATLSSIPAIPYLDYTETDPLGRAEWIKFSALFFGKEKAADSIFGRIETKYLSLKKLTDSLRQRPSVFSGKFFNGQWFVPGGKSYMAQIFRDAGADYLWKNDPHVASIPLNFETVFQRAKAADYWRMTGSLGTLPSYAEIGSENKLYTHFKAFREHHIIYCNTRQTAYFERGAMAPQRILADFIKAFHPELLPRYQPVFYHLLK